MKDVFKNKNKKILDKIKTALEKYKNFNGINLMWRVIILIIVTVLIVALSMVYNGSNIVWDITRINEDVGIFAETSINDILIDFGFTLSIILIGYSLIGSLKISMIFSIVIWMLINVFNYVLLDLRGTAFSFADIFSAGTAMNVLDGIVINSSKKLMNYVIVNVLLIISLIVVKFGKIESKKKRIISRVSNLCLSIVLMFGLMNTLKFLYFSNVVFILSSIFLFLFIKTSFIFYLNIIL